MTTFTKILAGLLFTALSCAAAFAADGKEPGVRSYGHVARAGLYQIEAPHTGSFVPPRYRVYRPSATATFDVAQLADVVSCNVFHLPLSWYCLDYPLAGKYEVIGERSPEIVTTSGVRQIRTKAGRHLVLEVNPTQSAKLEDGSEVRPYSFEQDFAATAFDGRCKSQLEGFETNPPVLGDSQIWGLRRLSVKGEIVWDRVYLIRHGGSVINNAGEVLAVDPIIGLNSFIFPARSGLAYGAAANVPFFLADPKATTVDPRSMSEAPNLVVSIDLMTGLPVTDAANIKAVDHHELVKVYFDQFNKLAEKSPGPGAECPLETLTSSEISDLSRSAISSLFN